ncbi:conserved hypothetical protein, partial [Stigmatella aurantiaca DW4/3-1]
MPEDGFLQGAGASIVEIARVGQHRLGEPEAPQRRGAPLLAIRDPVRTAIRESRSHVVQQQV